MAAYGNIVIAKLDLSMTKSKLGLANSQTIFKGSPKALAATKFYLHFDRSVWFIAQRYHQRCFLLSVF